MNKAPDCDAADWQERFLELLKEHHGIIKAAAEKTRVSRTAIYAARDRDPDFKARMDAVRHEARAALHDKLITTYLERLLGGNEEILTVEHGGSDPWTEVRKRRWTNAKDMREGLAVLFPELYSDRAVQKRLGPVRDEPPELEPFTFNLGDEHIEELAEPEPPAQLPPGEETP